MYKLDFAGILDSKRKCISRLLRLRNSSFYIPDHSIIFETGSSENLMILRLAPKCTTYETHPCYISYTAINTDQKVQPPHLSPEPLRSKRRNRGYQHKILKKKDVELHASHYVAKFSIPEKLTTSPLLPPETLSSDQSQSPVHAFLPQLTAN